MHTITSKFGDLNLIRKNKKLAREAAEAVAAKDGDKLYHVRVDYCVWVAEKNNEVVKVWASDAETAEELASDRFLKDFDSTDGDVEVDSTEIIKVEEHKDLKTIDMFTDANQNTTGKS